jgi:uncharacterized protein
MFSKKRLKLSGLICLAFTFLFINVSFAYNPNFPKPQGYVSDYASVIDRQTRVKIEHLARSLEQKTGTELAVVTVKSTLPYDHLEYANRLFAYWQIGKSGKDNGVLLLLDIKGRKVRIETGYGMEKIITDGKAGEILDLYVLPKFQKRLFAEGLFNGALAITHTIADFHDVEIDGNYYPVTQRAANTQDLFSSIFSLIFIILVLSGRLGILPFLMFGGFGGRHNSGFDSFGGGFGGFGGGFSGGGGASRGF